MEYLEKTTCYWQFLLIKTHPFPLYRKGNSKCNGEVFQTGLSAQTCSLIWIWTRYKIQLQYRVQLLKLCLSSSGYHPENYWLICWVLCPTNTLDHMETDLSFKSLPEDGRDTQNPELTRWIAYSQSYCMINWLMEQSVFKSTTSHYSQEYISICKVNPTYLVRIHGSESFVTCFSMVGALTSLKISPLGL